MRVTAVPEVRASAICSMFLYAGASRSFHDAGALRPFSLMNLSLDMNTSGSSAMAIHCPSACRKRGRKRREGGRLVRLEQSLVDPGSEGFHRSAEEHIHTRIVLFGNDAGERLAGREADEVDLDAGRLLEFLEHRPRPVLGPDRIDIQRVGRDGGVGTSCANSASPNNGRAAMARAARCSKRLLMIIGKSSVGRSRCDSVLEQNAVPVERFVARYRLV